MEIDRETLNKLLAATGMPEATEIKTKAVNPKCKPKKPKTDEAIKEGVRDAIKEGIIHALL